MKIIKTIPTMVSLVYFDNDYRYLRGEAGEMWIRLGWDGEKNWAIEAHNPKELEAEYASFLTEFNA